MQACLLSKFLLKSVYMHALCVHVPVHDCMHSIPNPQQKAELKRIRLGQIPIWLLASSGAQEKGSEGRSKAREGREGRVGRDEGRRR